MNNVKTKEQLLWEEQTQIYELSKKRTLSVKVQEVICSVVVDYLIEGCGKQIAILKRNDINARDILESSGYIVLQTDQVNSKALEHILDSKTIINKEPKIKKAEPKQSGPKYAAGGQEDRLNYCEQKSEIYRTNPQKKIHSFPKIITIAICIAIGVLIFGAQLSQNPITTEMQHTLINPNTGEQLVIVEVKNNTLGIIFSPKCTISVIDKNGITTYNKSVEISSLLLPKQKKHIQEVTPPLTIGAYTIQVETEARRFSAY